MALQLIPKSSCKFWRQFVLLQRKPEIRILHKIEVTVEVWPA